MPLILWTVIALLWVVPVPAMLGRAGLWAGVAMFAALTFYLRLSRALCLAMFVAFVVARPDHRGAVPLRSDPRR